MRLHYNAKKARKYLVPVYIFSLFSLRLENDDNTIPGMEISSIIIRHRDRQAAKTIIMGRYLVIFDLVSWLYVSESIR